ncbi:mercuric transporter MerT family protein [Acidithiobacillus sp.]|uniref:mercuric transporter MerT family protein n=1 Tax=Acidithiobacillus sp. TaxID=1872118 RepID=UPI002639F057|nr:mercuric transporter MerT family protein [Acidithiobacillus sp.]
MTVKAKHVDADKTCSANPQALGPARKGMWGLIVAVVVGFFASACCVLPLLLIVAGIGGAWMANLRVLEPYAPYLDVLALAFLIYAHVQNHREKKAAACGACAPVGRWKTPLLWAGTIVVLIVLALPHILPHLLMP